MSKKPLIFFLFCNILFFLVVSIIGTVGITETAIADSGGTQPPPLDTVPPIIIPDPGGQEQISYFDILFFTTLSIL